MADTDVRDVIAKALDTNRWGESGKYSHFNEHQRHKFYYQCDVCVGDTAGIAKVAAAALAEAGLVVVAAEDLATKANLDAMREDRDTWFEDACERRREMGRERTRANEAEAKLHAIGSEVKTWRNEDGKSFVFTEDILAILNPGAALPVTEETRDA